MMQISGVNSLRDAARWGETPIIKKKAVEASKNAMADDFVKKLQDLARKDAQKGVYMSQEAINLRHAQMGKYVSPDRSAPIAQMTKELQKAEKAHKVEDPTLEFIDRMVAQLKGKGRPERIVKSFSGLAGGCSGDLNSTPESQSATVYSPDGEQIAHYNSGNIGGWMNLTTRAENQFLGDSNTVYKQAWDAARAEMNAPKTSAQSAAFSESIVDFRA
ncbi:MAG: hypothetical protein K2P26_12370 [Oscillospiraceae bacterium]|nr:hypothetical protein [Oscillospiraceae bacterium]